MPGAPLAARLPPGYRSAMLGVAASECGASARRAGGAVFERVTITAPGPPVPVSLRPGGTLQVVAPSFAGVGAMFELYDATGARYEHPYARRLELRRGLGGASFVPIGPWRVRVVGDDGRVAEVDVVVQAGATAVAEIP
ncbi:MAG TPA: hypothetical protein VNB06_13560 [Thermoanaerobaculia bacterium]|nr:hypothetical protein [Thermoanaerobaculia bacterium]